MSEWIETALLGALTAWGLAAIVSLLALLPTQLAKLLNRIAQLLVAAGVVALGALIAGMWTTLHRPPLRTLGETRLWYAAILPLIGLLIELRTGTGILRVPMLAFGMLFAGINLSNPEMMDRTLMPALQSPWFVPHVVVYMVAYAALGLSSGAAIWSAGACLWRRRQPTTEDTYLPSLLVHLGFPFLTFGLVFGAIWAKEAWGHYWTWDPKETWSFLTWAAYIGVLHFEHDRTTRPWRTLVLIALSFLVVLGCWFLLNSLPAGNNSVHAYTQ